MLYVQRWTSTATTEVIPEALALVPSSFGNPIVGPGRSVRDAHFWDLNLSFLLCVVCCCRVPVLVCVFNVRALDGASVCVDVDCSQDALPSIFHRPIDLTCRWWVAVLLGRHGKSWKLDDAPKGETLLDVGSGPVVLSSLVASSRFKHIVLSDLVEGNRLELNKWINQEEDAIDWSHTAEQIAAIEGYSDIKNGALEIIERTRSAIRKVVPCDVLEPGVLPMEHRETFDVVLSSGCLDAAAADHESFRRVICNVAPLVKPGGLLVICGATVVSILPSLSLEESASIDCLPPSSMLRLLVALSFYGAWTLQDVTADLVDVPQPRVCRVFCGAATK
ncbi:hypothetical protein HPB47_026174 [Ixodes persulcatus]|uniref:Uncharacterized protein n=1 Tax=Ixodes persulcatus TaxID=34615 RepID=A0AC60PZG7_IXOPE|nr:hypothetical protein HPB47_026174 [Ixodes persulcatus]